MYYLLLHIEDFVVPYVRGRYCHHLYVLYVINQLKKLEKLDEGYLIIALRRENLIY